MGASFLLLFFLPPLKVASPLPAIGKEPAKGAKGSTSIRHVYPLEDEKENKGYQGRRSRDKDSYIRQVKGAHQTKYIFY